MRIKQLFCKFGGHFADAMSEKYSMVNCSGNINPKEPLFMFGCYDFRHMHIAINHARFNKQLSVICWGGSDSSNFRRVAGTVGDFWVVLLKEFDIKHIAISHWIAEDLEALGLKYTLLPVTPYDMNDIRPCAPGHAIYMYNPDSDFYGAPMYRIIRSRLPEFSFLEAHFGKYERKDLMDLYRKSFLGLRFTRHDGLSNTLCELGLMGRMVINNGDTPNCIHYDPDDIEDIIDKIRTEYEYCRDPQRESSAMIAAKVKDYLDIGDKFLYEDFYV